MPVFCLWNTCNNNCLMCTNPVGFKDPEDSGEYSKEEFLERMESRRSELTDGNPDINLTGGEPTIHPEFFKVLKEIRKRFPENTIAFSTNGRRFAYESFTKKVLSINNLRFQVAVHGPDPKTHDGLTRTPGSFKQTIAGIENLLHFRRESHKIEIRIVLTGSNFEKLGRIYEFLWEKFKDVERIVTIFPEYEGRAGKNFEKIAVTYPEVAERVERGVEKWSGKFNKFWLYHFPLCTLDSEVWSSIIRSLPSDHPEVDYLDKCQKCVYQDFCLGVYLDYVDHFGKDHFKPITRKLEGVETDPDDYQNPIKRAG